MYIEKGNSNEIPKDAIRLTSDEVYQYMSNLIQKWPSTKELWALKYGNPIMASAVVITSAVVLKFYRNKLKLRNYAQFTLFIPVVLIPSIFNQLFQHATITKSIILQEDCPVCISTQSMLTQLGTGIFYPTLSAISGTYMFAHKMGTISFNSVGINAVKEFAMHSIKTSRPLYNRLTVFVIGHLLLSYAISYYQMENIEFLKIKMWEQRQEEIENLQQNKLMNKKSQTS